MTEAFKRLATDMDWSYRCSFGVDVLVSFINPSVKTNVIYTVCELGNVLERSDIENNFIPVPRHVMQCAFDAVQTQQSSAA